MSVLFTQYEITTDCTGTKYFGLTISWDHKNGTVNISLPVYVERALHKFQHPISPITPHAPHAYSTPEYDVMSQLTFPDEKYDPLGATGTTRLKEIVGILLYYGQAVDSSILLP